MRIELYTGCDVHKRSGININEVSLVINEIQLTVIN